MFKKSLSLKAGCVALVLSTSACATSPGDDSKAGGYAIMAGTIALVGAVFVAGMASE